MNIITFNNQFTKLDFQHSILTRCKCFNMKQMKHAITFLSLALVLATSAGAQNRRINMDSAVTSSGTVTIKGQKISYTATAGKQPVWDEKGKPIAGLFYVYYEKTGVTDRASRPLVISFNGGPGAASCWMHLGYTGPRRLLIDDEGYPVQPYGITENPHSILDVADIVYIEPVNTVF